MLLPFLIAFLGILFIKNDLLKVEKTISYQEGLSVKILLPAFGPIIEIDMEYE